MSILELILFLLGIFTSMIDNLIQFYKKKILVRLIFAFFLFVLILVFSFTWIAERNEVRKVKSTITNFLYDDKFFSKLKNESEIEDHLLYLQYNKNSCNKAFVEMLRDNELIIERKKVTSSELNKNYNMKYFFLSRQYVEQFKKHL